jgi:DNA polymerase-3 subunit delta'
MIVWPDAVAKSPSAGVIDKALARDRLGNSLLFHSDSLETLEGVALAIAARMLGITSTDAPGRVLRHPDCFVLRPEGKARIIGVDTVRETIGDIQRTPQAGERKVAIIFEADRMNTASANVFLKTLEEPPLSTTILLLTTRPYSLLTTIRSRCLQFRFPRGLATAEHPDLRAWLDAYTEWIGKVAAGSFADSKNVTAGVIGLYGLIAQFEGMLDAAADLSTKQRVDELSERGTILTDEQLDALTTGISVGVRQNFLAEIEHATRDFVAVRASAGSAAELRDPMITVLRKLERCAGLLRANLSTTAALEDFLLTSLRAWARAGSSRS